MKKLLSLLVCFGLAIGTLTAVVGCGGDDKKPAPKADDKAKTDDKAKK